MELTAHDFALYIGQRAEFIHDGGLVDIGVIMGVKPAWEEPILLNISGDKRAWWLRPGSVKLILRKPDSMSYDEYLEVYGIVRDKNQSDGMLSDIMIDESHGIKGLLFGFPPAWKWMLEHGFDLFNWIEAGLALDAATLNAEMK